MIDKFWVMKYNIILNITHITIEEDETWNCYQMREFIEFWLAQKYIYINDYNLFNRKLIISTW